MPPKLFSSLSIKSSKSSQQAPQTVEILRVNAINLSDKIEQVSSSSSSGALALSIIPEAVESASSRSTKAGGGEKAEKVKSVKATAVKASAVKSKKQISLDTSLKHQVKASRIPASPLTIDSSPVDGDAAPGNQIQEKMPTDDIVLPKQEDGQGNGLEGVPCSSTLQVTSRPKARKLAK